MRAHRALYGSQRQPRADQQRRGKRRGLPFLLWWVLLLSAATVFTLGLLYSQLHSSSDKNRINVVHGEGARLERALPASCASRLSAAGLQPNTAQTLSRRRLYSAMATSFERQQLGSSKIQGMGLQDVFTVERGALRPRLERLEVPVRAIILPVTQVAVARQLAEASARHLVPLFTSEDALWLQNSNVFHSTVFHASSHLDPVSATPDQVDAESRAVQHVAHRACPLHVVLERVVATSSGAILACWQVARGTDPVQLRAALQDALPHASARQAVRDRAILHTTLARVVKLPALQGATKGTRGRRRSSSSSRWQRLPGRSFEDEAAAQAVQQAVQRMTGELCGLEATLDRLWFVEEKDKLALALDGEYAKRELPLECAAGEQEQQLEAEEKGHGGGRGADTNDVM